MVDDTWSLFMYSIDKGRFLYMHISQILKNSKLTAGYQLLVANSYNLAGAIIIKSFVGLSCSSFCYHALRSRELQRTYVFSESLNYQYSHNLLLKEPGRSISYPSDMLTSFKYDILGHNLLVF